jgi:glucose/mannose transport system substrate-binding protein
MGYSMLKGRRGAIKTAYVVILAVIITGAVVGVGTWYFTRPTKANVVEIYHWWTSGGEKAAIGALVDVFVKKYPDVGVIQSPVAGGAGYVMKALMKSLVLAGEAPDAFQLHAGYEMKPYVDGGYLDPINDLWTAEGWTTVFPTVVQDMVKFGTNYYAVPVNIHRVNVVWYNKHVLDAHEISANITTWDAFFAACDKLVAEGMAHPISLGDQGKWAATHVLEQIIASEGIGFYQDFINGKVTSAANTTLRDALTKFAKYLSYVNENHAALTWDGATAMVIRNESAFNIMGDWANGEFLVANKIYGVDYGTFPVPGTGGMYGLCIDCFEHPKGVKHPENSLNWLRVVGSKDGQDAFNPIKGSISARTDANISKYGAYQKAAIADFTTVHYMYPSIVHGSGMPEAFTAQLDDIISAFVDTKDVSAAATALTNAVTAASADFTKVWALH